MTFEDVTNSKWFVEFADDRYRPIHGSKTTRLRLNGNSFQINTIELIRGKVQIYIFDWTTYETRAVEFRNDPQDPFTIDLFEVVYTHVETL